MSHLISLWKHVLYSIYEGLSISKFTNATNHKTQGMQNQTIILTLALQLHTFYPAGFIHSNSVSYSQSKKTEVAYCAACFIFFKRAKKSCIAMQSHPFPWVSFIQTVDVLQTKLSQTSFRNKQSTQQSLSEATVDLVPNYTKMLNICCQCSLFYMNICICICIGYRVIL